MAVNAAECSPVSWEEFQEGGRSQLLGGHVVG
jgi:hypothetical protein